MLLFPQDRIDRNFNVILLVAPVSIKAECRSYLQVADRSKLENHLTKLIWQKLKHKLGTVCQTILQGLKWMCFLAFLT